MMKIAILGTGVMGSGLAEGFIKAGFETIVYNRTASKTGPLVALGAKAVSSPAEAILEADASILVLSDGISVGDLLLNEYTKEMHKGKKILNASTTTPSEIEKLELEVANLGGSLSEMSMLVGSEQLRERQGKFLLGCNEDVEAFWTGILKNVGEDVYPVGKVGNASKAEAPMIFGSMFISLTVAYSAAVAIKLNIPQEIITNQIASISPEATYLLPNMFARDYSQIMASVDSFKTVSSTAISTAKSLGLPTKALEDVMELYELADKRGYGNQDGTSIVEVLLNAAN